MTARPHIGLGGRPSQPHVLHSAHRRTFLGSRPNNECDCCWFGSLSNYVAFNSNSSTLGGSWIYPLLKLVSKSTFVIFMRPINHLKKIKINGNTEPRSESPQQQTLRNVSVIQSVSSTYQSCISNSVCII